MWGNPLKPHNTLAPIQRDMPRSTIRRDSHPVGQISACNRPDQRGRATEFDDLVQ
tara:strand:- start:654 stop:818 length:165 start_codon:yes stop_codon:yes gene_type:complete